MLNRMPSRINHAGLTAVIISFLITPHAIGQNPNHIPLQIPITTPTDLFPARATPPFNSVFNRHAMIDIDRDGVRELVLMANPLSPLIYEPSPSGLVLDRGEVPSVRVSGPSGSDGTYIVADLDGDGWDDLVDGYDILWNEQGTLVHGTARNTDGFTTSISGELADIDGDGYPELAHIISSLGNRIRIDSCSPERMFTSSEIHLPALFTWEDSYSGSISSEHIRFADFDGDGDDDILSINDYSYAGPVEAFIGINNRTPEWTSVLLPPVYPDFFCVLDTDGDGSDEALIYNVQTGEMIVAGKLSDGTVGVREIIPVTSTSRDRSLIQQHGHPFAADTNGDGVVEIVTSRYYAIDQWDPGIPVTVLPPLPARVGVHSGGIGNPPLHDLNLDGRLDYFSMHLSRDGNQIVSWLAQPDGSLLPPGSTFGRFTTANSTAYTDASDPGTPDHALARRINPYDRFDIRKKQGAFPGPTIVAFEPDSDTLLRASNFPFTISNAGHAALVDLDADGYRDLILAETSSQCVMTVRWWSVGPSPTGGYFRYRGVLAQTTSASCDARESDLWSHFYEDHNDPNSLFHLFQRTSETDPLKFEIALQRLTAAGAETLLSIPMDQVPSGFPDAIFATDLDEDGRSDLLLVESRRWAWPAIALPEGGFEFLDPITIPDEVGDGHSTMRPFPLDADGDGDTDLVIPVHQWERALILQNLPGTEFDLITAPFSIRSSNVTLADIDGDNLLDAVVQNGWQILRASRAPFTDDSIEYYLSNMRGLADVDGDGLLDLAASDYNETNLFAWLNRACPPDLNEDRVLDTADLISFVDRFLSQDPRIDFNHDGILDLGDIQAFVSAFLAGC